MSVPAFFWPPSGATARGVALVPFGAGMAVPDWTRPVLWPFSGGAFASGIAVGSGAYGFSSASPDASGGLWATTWNGVLVHVASGGTVLSTTTLPSGQAYVGTACCAGSGFAVTSSGTVYASGGSILGTFPTPVAAVAASGTTVAFILPASGVGTMNANTGATGRIALPPGIATPAALTLWSGGPLAVAGWSGVPPLSGAAAGAVNPQIPTRVLAVGSGFARTWVAPGQYADAWSQGQAVSGLAALVGAAWRPDGAQALAVGLAAGTVRALDYTLGVLSAGQTLSVSGACAVMVAGDSVHALVAQSGQAQAATLTYGGGAWTVGTPLGGLPGVAALAPFGASGAVAAVTAGLQFLNLSAGSWSSGVTVPLGFVPTAVAADSFGQVYAAGSGAVALVSGSTSVASGTWAGGVATAVAVQQGRVIVAVPSDGLLRVFGLSAAGTLSQQSTVALASGGAIGLALSTTTLFVMATGGTATYGFSGSPFILTPVLSGSVAFWNGSAWTTVGMGVGHVPTALGLAASGGVVAWVATRQNTLWNVTSGGVVVSSGALQQYPGQAQTVPLCVSSILSSGGIFAATSIAGVLDQVA